MDSSARTRRRWLILAALVAVHLAVLVIGPLATDEAGLIPMNDRGFASLAGLFAPHWLLGATAIVGLWVVFGSGHWYVRLGIGILGWLWLGMALVLGELMTPNWPWDLPAWLLAAGLAALASVVLSAAAYGCLGWRLTWEGVPLTQNGSQRLQFGLVHLVAAVTLVAATLGLARLLDSRFVHFSASYLLIPRYVTDWLWRASVEFWCPAVIGMGTIVLTLRSRPVLFWIVPLFLTLIVLDAGAQYGEYAYRHRVGLEHFSELYPLLLRERFVADGALLGSLLLSAGVLRILGYRLGSAAPRPPRDRTAELAA